MRTRPLPPRENTFDHSPGVNGTKDAVSALESLIALFFMRRNRWRTIRNALERLENQGSIGPAETKTVADGHLDTTGSGHQGHKIDVCRRVFGAMQVQGRGSNLALQRLEGHDRFNRAGSPQAMTNR